jgi:hypothetical protein
MVVDGQYIYTSINILGVGVYVGVCTQIHASFRAVGFFNETDTPESSSILIYSELRTGLYTQQIR